MKTKAICIKTGNRCKRRYQFHNSLCIHTGNDKKKKQSDIYLSIAVGDREQHVRQKIQLQVHTYNYDRSFQQNF